LTTSTVSRADRAQQRSLFAPFQATITFIVLGALAPLYVLTLPPAGTGVNVFLCLIITTISAAKIAYLIYDGRPRLLNMGFYLFVYPFMGLASLAQVSAGRYPLPSVGYSEQTISLTLGVVICGLLVYEIAYNLGSRRSNIDYSHPTASFSQGVVIAIGLFAIIYIGYTIATTGITPFFSSRDDAASALAQSDVRQVYELTDKTGFLLRSNLTRIPIFVALVGMLVMIREQTWRYGVLGRPATVAFLSVIIAANILVNNPIANSRFWFGTVLLTIASIYLNWRRPGQFRLLTYSGLTVFILAFGFLDVFRRSTATLSVSGPRETFISNGSYSAIQTALNGTTYIAEYSHTWGEQIVTGIFTFIPRSVWPSKGVDTGELIDPLYNRASTLWTEFYVDFGLVGVIIGFIAYGAFSTFADNRMPLLGATSAVVAVAGMGVQIILLRGSLVAAMGSLYPLLFFFLLAMIGSRRRSPRRKPDALAAVSSRRRRSTHSPIR